MEDPDKPATSGYRQLFYDVRNGKFDMWTVSFAKINCNMDFGSYPFDIQNCEFIMYLAKNSSYQETSQ